LIFVIVECGVLFEVRTDFLNIIYRRFGKKTVKVGQWVETAVTEMSHIKCTVIFPTYISKPFCVYGVWNGICCPTYLYFVYAVCDIKVSSFIACCSVQVWLSLFLAPVSGKFSLPLFHHGFTHIRGIYAANAA